MYSNYNKTLPKPIQAIYTPNINIHSHNTRQQNDMHIMGRGSNLVSHSFIHRSLFRNEGAIDNDENRYAFFNVFDVNIDI